jgi:signal transduction histidine kinase
VNLVPLEVDFTTIGPVFLPTNVAGAIADAAGEALNNVVKYAIVDNVQVRLSGDQHEVRVEVVDRSKGFDPSDVADTRRGLRESVHNRMARIAGQAYVASAPGVGTTVKLEWSDV